MTGVVVVLGTETIHCVNNLLLRQRRFHSGCCGMRYGRCSGKLLRDSGSVDKFAGVGTAAGSASSASAPSPTTEALCRFKTIESERGPSHSDLKNFAVIVEYDLFVQVWTWSSGYHLFHHRDEKKALASVSCGEATVVRLVGALMKDTVAVGVVRPGIV
ncbi:hypothetical protein CC77DRAFT_1008803 [Alternaria alternata]|uniref:Uncharacterized protein n=1 Tax=Alternaria alternata TaxID=5599 RepID=A0A177DMS2_ALTAL|nr:hypothetical protein CC77DRAFT_1008803 [Alternaria alternata]OAG20776.1 hypothetical protein CC77DRAFT_1008803 [Alternaria alternata]